MTDRTAAADVLRVHAHAQHQRRANPASDAGAHDGDISLQVLRQHHEHDHHPAQHQHHDAAVVRTNHSNAAAVPQIGLACPSSKHHATNDHPTHSRTSAEASTFVSHNRQPDLVGLADTSNTFHSANQLLATSLHQQAWTLAAKMLGSAHRYLGYNTARLAYEHHRAHRRKLDTSLADKLVRNPRRKGLERMRTSKILKAVLILAEVLVDMTLVVLYCVEMSQSVEDFPQFKTLDLKPTWLWQPRPRWLWEVVVGLSLFNLASLVARIYFSESPLRSLFLNPLGIVDLLTIVPAIVSMPLKHGQYLFFPYFLRSIVVIPRLRRLIHIRMEMAEIAIPVDALRERMIVQIATLLCILYVVACAFQYVELVIGNKTYQVIEVLYFSMVSLTTVGYGDIHAETDLGRLVVMIGIAVAFVVIPSLVGSVIETHRARKAGGGAYHGSHTPHVVLVGRFDRAPFVASIIHAFFSNETAIPVRIVLFSRHSPTADVKNIINAPIFHERVHFIKGSPLNESDLSRTQLRSALAVFVLSSYMASEDERNVLRVWSIAQYAPHVELYVFHHRPEYARFHLGHATAVVCAEDLRQALLAVACIHPGAATLVTNLVNDAKPLEAYATPWLAQYGDGLGHELYNLPVPSVFLGRRFVSVCAYLFREFQVVAIAVRVPVVRVDAEGEYEIVDYHVALNPGAEYVFCGSEEIVTLAQGIRELELIQKLTPEAFERSLEGEANLFHPSFTKVCEPRLAPRHSSPAPTTIYASHIDSRSIYIGYPTAPPNSVDPSNSPICHLLAEPPDSIDAVQLHSSEDFSDPISPFRDYTLVITSRWNLFRFLCTLRSAHIPRADLKPILFLSSSLPSPDEFRALAAFPLVYYLQADPRSPMDLEKARLVAAERVVIMGGPSEHDACSPHGMWQTEVDDFADLDAILTRHMVTRAAARVRELRRHVSESPGGVLTVVELNTASSIKFLAPSYASGSGGDRFRESASLPASGTATPRSTSVLFCSRTQSCAAQPVSRVHQVSQQQEQQQQELDSHGGAERVHERKPTLPFVLSTTPNAKSPERIVELGSPMSFPNRLESLSSLSISASVVTSTSPSSLRQSLTPLNVELVSSAHPLDPSRTLQVRSPPPPHMHKPRTLRAVRCIDPPSETPPRVPFMTSSPLGAPTSHSSLSINDIMAEHGYLARRKTRRKRAPTPGTELPMHQQEQGPGSTLANHDQSRLRADGAFAHHIGYPPPARRTHMFFDPRFASGEAFVAEMLNTILISHFFNPTVLEIVRLLSGIRRRQDLELDDMLGLRPSSLSTETVPNAYVGRPFKDLFIDFCLHRQVVTLGLYRARNSQLGNTQPFVYTGPHPDVVLFASDVLFVLRPLECGEDASGQSAQATDSCEAHKGGDGPANGA